MRKQSSIAVFPNLSKLGEMKVFKMPPITDSVFSYIMKTVRELSKALQVKKKLCMPTPPPSQSVQNE